MPNLFPNVTDLLSIFRAHFIVCLLFYACFYGSWWLMGELFPVFTRRIFCGRLSLFFLPSQDGALSGLLSQSPPHLLLSSWLWANPCIPACVHGGAGLSAACVKYVSSRDEWGLLSRIPSGIKPSTNLMFLWLGKRGQRRSISLFYAAKALSFRLGVMQQS